MYKSYLALSALAATATAAASDHWAVIVAGSNGFYNYRHQADVCHAYQIMKKNGIPESQIILISYDDVASSSQNPFKGQLFNKPTPAGTPGVDVYAGCKVDYRGNDATAANVINVLKGDSTATGGRKVLKSNANSRVFFYFADHGAPGLVAMPVGGYLYADAFHKTLQFMHTNKMYKEMVVYIEACESGSMFQNILENNLNIYAVSAANASESSWGTYCSPDDKVNGKSVGSCLGDLFSVNWLEDAEKAKMGTETLQDQYNTVKAKTTKSHVLQWGELDWTKEPIGDFESGLIDSEGTKDFWNQLKSIGKKFIKDVSKFDELTSTRKNDFAVDSRDVKLHYLYTMVKEDPSIENMKALQDELAYRTEIDNLFGEMFPVHVDAVKNKTFPAPTEFDCLRQLIDHYEGNCLKLDDYSLKWVASMVSECEGTKAFPSAREESLKKMTHSCQANGYIQSLRAQRV
jgi:legumain